MPGAGCRLPLCQHRTRTRGTRQIHRGDRSLRRVFIPKAFGGLIAATGDAQAALSGFVVFHGLCIVVTWSLSTRTSALMQLTGAAAVSLMAARERSTTLG